MLSEKEIKKTFELLNITIDESTTTEKDFSGFIDKHPLSVKFQTTTSIQS